MDDNIKKGLEKIDNPLVKQTAEFLVAKLDEAADDESYDVAKSALLMYLSAAAPGVLKNDVAVERALTKMSEPEVPEVETIDAQRLIKEALASSGIYYFGNLDKHLLTGPHYIKPIPNPPHDNLQEKHGNRPGRRTLIGVLSAWKKYINPNIDIPKRAEMIHMEHEDLLRLAAKYIPEKIYTGVGRKLRSVDAGDEGDSLRRRSIDGSDGFRFHGRGKGKNMREEEYLRNILEMIGETDLQSQGDKVKLLAEKPRRPGKTVVDYEEGVTAAGKKIPKGATRTLNETTLAERSEVPGTGGGRSGLGTSPRTGSQESHLEYDPKNPRAGQEIKNPFETGKLTAAEKKRIKDRAKALESELTGEDARVPRGAGEAKPKEDKPDVPTPEVEAAAAKPASSLLSDESLPEVINNISDIQGTKLGALFNKLPDRLKKAFAAKIAKDGISPDALRDAIRKVLADGLPTPAPKKRKPNKLTIQGKPKAQQVSDVKAARAKLAARAKKAKSAAAARSAERDRKIAENEARIAARLKGRKKTAKSANSLDDLLKWLDDRRERREQ